LVNTSRARGVLRSAKGGKEKPASPFHHAALSTERRGSARGSDEDPRFHVTAQAQKRSRPMQGRRGPNGRNVFRNRDERGVLGQLPGAGSRMRLSMILLLGAVARSSVGTWVGPCRSACHRVVFGRASRRSGVWSLTPVKMATMEGPSKVRCEMILLPSRRLSRHGPIVTTENTSRGGRRRCGTMFSYDGVSICSNDNKHSRE
jgi:hypothetical protein